MSTSPFSSLPVTTRAYVSTVVAAGAMIVLESLYQLWAFPISWDWTILALLTLVSGSATVRLPSLPATISVSETFVFTSVLLFGPAVGTLIVALDALVISGWSYKKGHPLYKIVFNVCALPLTIWIASHAFFILAGIQPLYDYTEPFDARTLVVPLLVFTVLYFSLNSWIITFAIALEKQLPPLTVWRQHFPWLSLNYFGGASVAWLLVSYTRNIDYTYLAVIIPLLIVLYLTFSVSMGRVEDANKHLTQLNALYMSTVETLAMAIDAKDQITHGHIRRVQTYAVALAKQIGVTDPKLIKAVEAAALLHDMGKLAVPEYILNKPGPLTPAEFEKMKLHASAGADLLAAIDFPYPVVPIVRHHHESWDGSGYPDGLSGADIPIGARILSVVDCYDALTSDRPYRPRLSDKDALKILGERRGSMYDPLIVDTFVRVYSTIAVPNYEIKAPFAIINSVASRSPFAIEAGDRLDDIAGSTEEMLTLFELARGLTSPMNFSDVSDLIAKHLRRLVPCSMCVFFVYDVEADELVAKHATGDHASFASDLRIGLGQRLSGWVAAHRQTIRNSDPSLDLGDAARAISPRPRSCISTPLVSGQELVGVLTLYSTRSEAFSGEHQRVLEVIARQISPILGTAAEAHRSRPALLRDQLTGLPNLEQMRQALGRDNSGSLPSPTSLILLYFKDLSDFNKTHGRESADEALARLTNAARGELRAADLLFRYDGDEFVALLLQTGLEAAEAIAGRIRVAIDRERGTMDVPFAVSVKTATSPHDGASLESLVETARHRVGRPERADRRLVTPPDSIH